MSDGPPIRRAKHFLNRGVCAIDNLSHAAIGSAVAALAPAHPAIALGVLLGAEVPDFDYVIKLVGGPVKYLTHHRGPTHGLVVLPLHAAIICGVLRFIWPAEPFWALYWWTLAGCLSHVLFDCGNDYGTQAFWPFSPKRVALDIIPIVDVWVLGLIAVGWLTAWLWPGHRFAVFTAVWVLIAAYAVGRVWLRAKALSLVQARFDLSEPCHSPISCGRGWRSERLGIYCTLLSLNAWRYAVQMPGEYLTGMVWLREGEVGEPERAVNRVDQLAQASLKSQFVSSFADWVRCPRVDVKQEGGLYKVQWSDVRYEADGWSPFTAYAWLDDQMKLVDDGLGAGRPSEIDRGMLKRRLLREMGRREP